MVVKFMQNNYISICSDVVMAILSHKTGFEALRCSKGEVTPMRLLIEYLPGLYTA